VTNNSTRSMPSAKGQPQVIDDYLAEECSLPGQSPRAVEARIFPSGSHEQVWGHPEGDVREVASNRGHVVP